MNSAYEITRAEVIGGENCPFINWCIETHYPPMCEENHEMCRKHNGWVSYFDRIDKQNE